MPKIAIPPQRYDVTTAATADPVSLDDVKDYVRIDSNDDDKTVRTLIKSATNHLQRITGRQFVDATITAYFDDFPNSIEKWLELRILPVSAVNSVKYIDTNGTLQTWSSSNYQADVNSDNLPARIRPVQGESWPTARDELYPVRVEFQAGYADQSSVPDDIKYAISLLVSHWYSNREPTGVSARQLDHSLQALIDSISWHMP